jgi:hypothetical protein
MSDAQIVARVAARTMNRIAGDDVKNLIQDLVMKNLTPNLQRLVASSEGAADAIDDWAEKHTTVPHSREELAELSGLTRRFKFLAHEMLKLLDVSEHMSRDNLAEYFSQYTQDGQGDAPFHESHAKFDAAAKQLDYLREGVQDLRKKWYYFGWFTQDTTSEEISQSVYDLATEMAFCRDVYRQFRDPMVEVLKVVQNSPGFRRL